MEKNERKKWKLALGCMIKGRYKVSGHVLI